MSNTTERFVLQADGDRGWDIHRMVKMHKGMSDVESRAEELIKFGFDSQLVKPWMGDAQKLKTCEEPHDLGRCLITANDAMQRLRPNGITGLGKFTAALRDVLHSRFQGGTILDFGCGGWPDLSAALAMESSFHVQLMDKVPLPTYFCSWALDNRGVKNTPTVIADVSTELDAICDDVVFIIECSSFEHVPDIRWMFEPLMRKLPSGGLFWTNYTRLNWGRSDLDGYDESKQYAHHAVDVASSLAYRYQLLPGWADEGCWDLWEMK